MVLPLRGAHKQGIWRVRTPRVATAATAKGFEWWTTWQKQEEQSKSQNLIDLNWHCLAADFLDFQTIFPSRIETLSTS